jgi:anti-sigma B factor antagonist
MALEEAPIRIRRSDGVIHVDLLEPKLIDDITIGQIREKLSGLIDAEARPRLIVSFAGVDRLSSMALGALIAVHNKMSEKKGQLRLVGIAPRVHDIFLQSGLTALFEIHETTEQAIASMS